MAATELLFRPRKKSVHVPPHGLEARYTKGLVDELPGQEVEARFLWTPDTISPRRVMNAIAKLRGQRIPSYTNIVHKYHWEDPDAGDSQNFSVVQRPDGVTYVKSKKKLERPGTLDHPGITIFNETKVFLPDGMQDDLPPDKAVIEAGFLSDRAVDNVVYLGTLERTKRTFFAEQAGDVYQLGVDKTTILNAPEREVLPADALSQLAVKYKGRRSKAKPADAKRLAAIVNGVGDMSTAVVESLEKGDINVTGTTLSKTRWFTGVLENAS